MKSESQPTAVINLLQTFALLDAGFVALQLAAVTVLAAVAKLDEWSTARLLITGVVALLHMFCALWLLYRQASQNDEQVDCTKALYWLLVIFVVLVFFGVSFDIEAAIAPYQAITSALR